MSATSNDFGEAPTQEMSSNNFQSYQLSGTPSATIEGNPVQVFNARTGNEVFRVTSQQIGPTWFDKAVFFAPAGIVFGDSITNPTHGFRFEGDYLKSQVSNLKILDDSHNFYDAAGNLVIDGQNGPVMLSASMAVGQSVPDSTNTNLVFDTLVHGNGVTYSAATGIATVNVAGWFRVSGQFSCGIGAANSTILNVMKNGANVHSSQLNGSSNNGAVIVDKLIQCAAGDTLNLMVWHNAGVAWTCSTSGTVFEINKIS